MPQTLPTKELSPENETPSFVTGETQPDKDGLVRPTFRVGEVDVAFYSQDEESLARDQQEVLSTVIASPLGLTEAAIHLGDLSEDSRAARLHASILAEDYNEDVLHYLDQINAAVSYDEQGNERVQTVNEQGFALVIAALEGDPTAQKSVDSRLEKFQAEYAAAQVEGVEPISPEKQDEALDALNTIALVHSTKHSVERDKHGNVILSATGDHRRRDTTIDDRYPRATLHFTMNGEVTTHTFNESWVDTNTLIVANLAKTIDTGRLPLALNPVDTYFDVNPGEKLKLPDAITITPSGTLPELYQQDGLNISYKQADRYSDEDRNAYSELVDRPMILVESMTDDQIATGLRTYAIDDALKQSGVEGGAMFIQSNASGSAEFNNHIRNVGQVLGLETSLHRDHAVSRAEQRIRQEKHYRGGHYTFTQPLGLSLAAQRMYVANGYLAPGSRISAAEEAILDELEGDGL